MSTAKWSKLFWPEPKPARSIPAATIPCPRDAIDMVACAARRLHRLAGPYLTDVEAEQVIVQVLLLLDFRALESLNRLPKCLQLRLLLV